MVCSPFVHLCGLTTPLHSFIPRSMGGVPVPSLVEVGGDLTLFIFIHSYIIIIFLSIYLGLLILFTKDMTAR